MALFVWSWELDPDFPLAALEYTTQGDRDRMHWHEYLEIALVLEGRGSFRFGRHALPADEGDVFFIDDSHPHVAVAEPGTELRLLLVLFRPELIAGPGCRPLDAGYLAPFSAGDLERSRLAAGSCLAEAVTPVLHELRETWERGGPDGRYLVDATLRRVLGLVNRDRGECAPPPERSDRVRIRPVLAYVEGHCQESVTLEDVAEVVHVSPSRVRHLFKDATGVSFKEYVTHVRVAESKRLLLGTDLSVEDVARQVSYTNLHQFYKVFHRSCSMSPAEYRRYYTRAASGPGAVAGEGGPSWTRGAEGFAGSRAARRRSVARAVTPAALAR